MSWQLVMAANFVIAAAYAVIAYLIISGLLATGQLRTNRLGVATALIFVTSAGHHALEAFQLLLPSLGSDTSHGLALRHAWDWHMVVWDLLTAIVGIYYLSLRGSQAGAPRGAQMFDDLKVRERQALEINDNIVQGLTVAKYAMSIGAEDHTFLVEDSLRVR